MPSAFFLPFRVAENKKRKKATHVGALCLPATMCSLLCLLYVFTLLTVCR